MSRDKFQESCFVWLCYLTVLPLFFNGPQFSEAGCNGLTPSESKFCACVGDGLTFNCTINGIGITEWSGSAFDCPGDHILLRHSNFKNGTMGNCNNKQIVGRSLEVDNDCYSSQLTTNATASLNSMSVQCIHNFNGKQYIIGVISLTVISGPPTQPRVSVDICTGKLVFSWQPVPNCSLVEYRITDNNCGFCTLNATSATCLNLTLSTVVSVCSFSVRSMACGFSGTPSLNNVNIKVPDIPIVLAILPVYHYKSGDLTGVSANISEETPFNLTDDISGSVLRYNFSFSLTADPIIMNASCEDGVCRPSIDNIPIHLCPPSYSVGFNVTLSAANALGLGPQSLPFYVGCKNQFVKVAYNPDTSTVACIFPKNANYLCSIEYWMCQDTNMNSNTRRNNTVGSDQVLLQIQFDGSVEYCYEVMASNDTFVVIVKGSFNAPSGVRTNTTVEVVLGSVIPIIFLLVLIVVVVVIIVIIYRKGNVQKCNVGQRPVFDNGPETVTIEPDDKAKLQTASGIAREKETFEGKQSSDIESEKGAEHTDGDSSDPHEKGKQRDTAYLDRVGDFGYSIASGTVSAIGSYVASMVLSQRQNFDNETEDVAIELEDKVKLQAYASDVAGEKETSEGEQSTDIGSEKDAEHTDDGDSDFSDPHKQRKQRDTTYTDKVCDFSYSVASGTVSAVGSGVTYIASMVRSPNTEPTEKNSN